MNNSERKCKLCGKDYEIIINDLHDNRYGLPGNYSIGYCHGCGLGETFPKPSSADIPSIYEETIGDSSATLLKKLYRKYKRSNTGIILAFRLDRANRFLEMLPPPSEFPKLLDIGCGSGDWLTFFKVRGYEVQGLDLNPRVVEVARARDLNVRCQRVEELAEKGESFDVVVLSQVVEHIPEPFSVLKEIRKILKPGGRLLVAVPNLESKWRYCFGRYWINWYVPFHRFHFGDRAFVKVLTDSGFAIEKIHSYTPPTWLLNSIILKYLDRDRVPNRFVNKWWHHLLLPFVSAYLLLSEKLTKEVEGDCLCVRAKKLEDR